MENYIVETIGLTKQYKKQKAVNNLHMKVEKGAIYGFIGRNGAGKTTTLKMLCGLAKPTSGSVHLFQDTRKEYTYRSIGALIEHVGAYPDLSAKENMMLKAVGFEISDKSAVEDILKLLHLDTTGKKLVKHFSLGMKQRLGIALALLGKPDLLILDKPTNGLDPEGIHEVCNIWQSEAKEIFVGSSSIEVRKSFKEWHEEKENRKSESGGFYDKASCYYG